MPATETDRFFYFAYGSNMSARRLRSPDRAPSAKPLGLAHIDGYRLVFDKVSKDGSSKADCEYTGDLVDRTYGGVFEVSVRDLDALDRAEGASGRSPGYRRVPVVIEKNGEAVQAITYLANASHKSRDLLPYDWYVKHVLVGASEFGLPADYCAKIANTQTQADSDIDRVARELAIYSDS